VEHDKVATLDELVRLCTEWAEPTGLYVRWTPDCRCDLDEQASTDELTGVPLPGLSANGLAVESWWGDRPLDVWIARRLHDYRHLVERRGAGTRPWVLTGREVGRGPDNEPLLSQCHVVAEVDFAVIDEAVELVESMPADWGSLRRA
jgi:hypothetical protein